MDTSWKIECVKPGDQMLADFAQKHLLKYFHKVIIKEGGVLELSKEYIEDMLKEFKE